MEYYSDSNLSIQLENVYNNNLITRSFTALFYNLLNGRRRALLEQILRLYRKKTLLIRGFSALREHLHIKKYFYSISDRQLVGNFLLRWHSSFEGRLNIRNLKSKFDKNLIKKCFKALYNPVLLRSKWALKISKIESIIFLINSEIFISELSYSRFREDVEEVAKSHYKSKMLKKIFTAFIRNFEFNYRISVVEALLQRHLCHKENNEVLLFKKRLVFSAWRRVILESIADDFHNIYMIRSFFHYWHITSKKMHQLRIRYEQFSKRVDLNILSNVFGKIIKVWERKENIIYYFNIIESLSRRIILKGVFDNLRCDSHLAESQKIMIKTSEVSYISSLKSRAMNSFILYKSIMDKKRRLKQIGDVWSANSLKSKYFYLWKSMSTESNSANLTVLEKFSESVLSGFKKSCFISWYKFTNKMSTLRYNATQFIARDSEISMGYYWNLWINNYLVNRHSSLELLLDRELFEGFDSVISVYPRQILFLFSSPCNSYDLTNISNIGNKTLSVIIESLQVQLPSFYDRLSCDITCIHHDQLRYSCILSLPKWKNILISNQVRRMRLALKSWRNHVSDKIIQRNKLQSIVEIVSNKRNSRLVSHSFYAWVELMAVCYVNRREQYLTLVGKLCSSIERPFRRECRLVIDELYMIRFNDIYNKNIIKKCISSLKKQVLITHLYDKMSDFHAKNMVKYMFLQWKMAFSDRNILIDRVIKSVELLSLKRSFSNFRISISFSRVNKAYQVNLMKHHFSLWKNMNKIANYEVKLNNKLMLQIFTIWRNIVKIGAEDRALEAQITTKYDSKLMKKSFLSWNNLTLINVKLTAISDQIKIRNNTNLLKFIFNIWYNRSKLLSKLGELSLKASENHANSLLNFAFNHWISITKLSKFMITFENKRITKIAINHWIELYRNIYQQRRELELKLQLKSFNVIEEIIYNNESRLFIIELKQYYNRIKFIDKIKSGMIYKSLESLSNLSQWRMELGFQSLRLNLRLKQFNKNINKRVIINCIKFLYNRMLIKRLVIQYIDKYNNKLMIQYLHLWINILNHRANIRRQIEYKFENERLELLKLYFKSWMRYSLDSDIKSRIKSIEIWTDRRRAAEGFRRLRQFTMDKKWYTICNHQASIFRALRDVSRTKTAFYAWKNVIKDNL